MAFLNHVFFTFIEKVIRWSLHLKIRGHLLSCVGAKIGKSVRVSEVFFANLYGVGRFSNLTLHDNVYIGPNCLFDLTGKVEVGAYTAVSPSCTFITHSDPGSMTGNRLTDIFPRKVEPISIGSHCWIGAGAIILCGVSIGNGSVVGAGAVVNKNVPEGVVVAGNPAKIVRMLKLTK